MYTQEDAPFVGCINKFKGDFTFKNDSKSGITVEDMVCFELTPPCGYLSPGASASSRSQRGYSGNVSC